MRVACNRGLERIASPFELLNCDRNCRCNRATASIEESIDVFLIQTLKEIALFAFQ